MADREGTCGVGADEFDKNPYSLVPRRAAKDIPFRPRLFQLPLQETLMETHIQKPWSGDLYLPEDVGADLKDLLQGGGDLSGLLSQRL